MVKVKSETAFGFTSGMPVLAEDERMWQSRDRSENWQRWGPYLSERQWGTVREDYSPNGDA